MKPDHVVIWFKDEAAYLRFQNLCPDMASSYDQWFKLATQQIRELERTIGMVMVKVVVNEADAEEFAAWCKVNHQTPDRRARATYAGIKGNESGNVSQN
jgi:hypothetical protein